MAAVVFSTQRTAVQLVVVMTLVQPYWLARKVCSYSTARKVGSFDPFWLPQFHTSLDHFISRAFSSNIQLCCGKSNHCL